MTLNFYTYENNHEPVIKIENVLLFTDTNVGIIIVFTSEKRLLISKNQYDFWGGENFK